MSAADGRPPGAKADGGSGQAQEAAAGKPAASKAQGDAVPSASGAPKAGANTPSAANGDRPPTADLTKPVLKEQLNTIHDGRLVGWECTRCRHQSLSPIVRCPNGHKSIVQKEFSKTGSLEAWTVQVVSTEQYMNEVPFAWVIVKLDEGPRVTGWVPFIRKHDELKQGQRLRFNPGYKPGIEFEVVKE